MRQQSPYTTRWRDCILCVVDDGGQRSRSVEAIERAFRKMLGELCALGVFAVLYTLQPRKTLAGAGAFRMDQAGASERRGALEATFAFGSARSVMLKRLP